MARTYVTPLVALLVAILASSCNASTPKARVFSSSEARQVLYEYLRSTGATKRPGFVLDEMRDPYNPSFYFFSAMADNGPEASVVLRNYAVDQRSGDIWDGSICEEMISRESRARQYKIRQRLHITPANYARLKRLGPTC